MVQGPITVLLEQEGLISREQAESARTHSLRRAEHPAHVILTRGILSRAEYRNFMVKKLGIQDVKLIGKSLPRPLVMKLKQTFIMRNQSIPIELNGTTLVVAMLDPTDHALVKEIEELTALDVRPVFTTDLDINWQYHAIFGRTLVHRAVYNLFWNDPDSSAAVVVTRKQLFSLIGGGGVFLLALTLSPMVTLKSVSATVSIFYLASIVFKFVLTMAGSRYELTERVSRKEIKTLTDDALPVYSILIPLFKEASVLPKLAQGINKLDYPPDKLDVKLLLEQDDNETLEALRDLPFPALFDFAVVPNFGPRTKPKACNYGLYLARGKYLTIYDAEDKPDPDQLKKVVVLFRKEAEDVVCIQAALNYYNSNENFLTRMFTLEYSYWFDYLLRGMERFKFPIPLGGTSNHFRVDKLRELGGWDPFNVTEDADLGVRASIRGYRVAILSSTTYEEANRALGNWIRQRSRWIKGYMQTWLVHNRHPIRLLKRIGWKGFLGFHYFIGATPLTFLINPILWGVFIVWLFVRMKWIDVFFPPLILYISLFCLLIGNLIVIYMNMLAVFKRRIYTHTLYALLNPFYWILHSIASYKAAWQLITNPFYWEKTQHGLSKVEDHIEFPR